ncbi:hypothetical protein ACOMHN_029809 [Nucella lapillus]
MAFRYPGSSTSSHHNHHSTPSYNGTHSSYPSTHTPGGGGHYPSTSSLSSSPGGYTRTQRPDSFSSGYGSDYNSPGYVSPGYVSPILSPSFRYAQSPIQSPTPLQSPTSPSMKVYDVNSNPREQAEYERSLEYHQAPDTFPCGHVLCHKCIRRFMKTMGGAFGTRCPVCRVGVSSDDVSLASMGLPGEGQDEAPISLLSNYGEIVKKFNGIQSTLRRLKDESVQARSMGMTYTNTLCHLCREAHPTLRVIQEHNQLQVSHERPTAWSNYFYRLQHGKVVTTFYSKVNASTICVPCTYRELQESKSILPSELQSLPDVDPSRHQQLVLAEVGKIVAKNTAPLMALQGKSVVEVDHKIRVRERADHFNFLDTAQQIEHMVQRQEENLLQFATKQIRDTGQVYHVQESNEMELDMDETAL